MGAPAYVLQSGELIAGKYRIEQLLGTGGMSAVYAAIHVGLDQRIALKMLHPQYAADPKIVGRFIREAKASARINGDHVGRVIDVGATEGGAPFMALELLHGQDLGAYVDTAGPLPIDEAVDLVIQACDGIARAHAVGIIHRDIKPSNLFLTDRDGAPCLKVIDFGISKVMSGDEHALTQTTEIFGSPQYMSPEQVKASRDVDGRTDVWSLGCVLYELLTAKVPFEAASVMMLGSVILNETQKSLCEHRPEIPAALDAIVARCLAKDPAARPATVLELAIALQPFAAKDAGLIDSMRRLGTNPPVPATSSARSVFVVPDTEPRVNDAPTVLTGPPRSRRTRLLAIGLAMLGITAAVALVLRRPARPAHSQEVAPPSAIAPEPPPAAPTAASIPPAVTPAVTANDGANPVASAAPPPPRLPGLGRRPAPAIRTAATPATVVPTAEVVAPAPVKSSSIVRDRHGGD